MNNEAGQVVSVSPKEMTVCCRGANKALGHPAVYLSFGNQATVKCYYCGCEFKKVLDQTDSLQNVS